jgi:tetratricopeptide (TPR) repeat protein
LAADEALSKVIIWQNNTARHLVQIAEQALAGELAAAAKDYDSAITHLKKAVSIEDSLVYEEPQSWYQPTRLNLGAVLLEAGKPADAERAFREDLVKYPNNAWALFGLQQALVAQGRAEPAAQAERAFKQQWKLADVTLKSARF